MSQNRSSWSSPGSQSGKGLSNISPPSFNSTGSSMGGAGGNRTFSPQQNPFREDMFNSTGPGFNQSNPAVRNPGSPLYRNAMSFSDEPGAVNPNWQNEWQDEWNALNARRQAEESILSDLGISGRNLTTSPVGSFPRDMGVSGFSTGSSPTGGLSSNASPGFRSFLNEARQMNISGPGEGTLNSSAYQSFLNEMGLPAIPNNLISPNSTGAYNQTGIPGISRYDPNQDSNSFRLSPPRGGPMDLSLRTQGDSPFTYSRFMDSSLGGGNAGPPYDYDGLKHNLTLGSHPRNEAFMNLLNEAVEMRAKDMVMRMKNVDKNRDLNQSMMPSIPGGYSPLGGNDPRMNLSLGASPRGNPNQLMWPDVKYNPVGTYGQSNSFSAEPRSYQPLIPGPPRRNVSFGGEPIPPELIDLERAMAQQGFEQLRNKDNLAIQPKPRSKSPKRRSVTPRKKSQEGETIPDDVLNDIFKLIVGKKEKMKKDLVGRALLEKFRPEMPKILDVEVAELVTFLGAQEITQFLLPILPGKTLPIVTAALMDMYGPGLVSVLPTLKDGTFVCSKPCVCGQEDICGAKTGGECQGPVASGCGSEGSGGCCNKEGGCCAPSGGSCCKEKSPCGPPADKAVCGPPADKTGCQEHPSGGCNDACASFKKQLQSCGTPKSSQRACQTGEDGVGGGYSDVDGYYNAVDQRGRSPGRDRFPAMCINSCPCKRGR